MPKVRKIPTPAIPDDLPGWVWELGETGMRLVNAPEGYATTWQPGDRESACVVEARQLQQRDAALLADDEGPLMTLAELDAAASGHNPDASGVFRRPPALGEQATIPVGQIVRGRFQPRTTFDDASMGELIASIQAHGILTRLKVFVNETGAFELIAGERRWRAAQQMELPGVPVEVGEYTLAQIHEISIVDNLQREGLTPTEEGQAYERMIAELGISEAELSRRIGKPRSYIQQRRALASAAPEVAAALASGQISFTLARGICAGAPGHHLAQVQALKDIQNRSSWQGTATEADAQTYAEEAVLSTAKEALQHLGWKVRRFSPGSGKTLTVVYSDRERPRAWTGADILAALSEQRRPSEVGAVPAPATLSAADRKVLKRRGWDADLKEFAPWIVAQAPRAKFLSASELPALIEQARKDFEELAARYTAAGWTLSQSSGSTNDSFEATTKEGRTQHPYSWGEATKLATKIESGAETREPNTTMRECAECKQTKPVVYDQRSERSAYRCAACIAKLNAEAQRIRAELRHELAQLAGDWIASAPERVVRLMATAVPKSDRIGLSQYANADAKAAVIRAASEEMLRELLLDILESAAYAWRDQDIGGHAVAGDDERSVGEEGGIW